MAPSAGRVSGKRLADISSHVVLGIEREIIEINWDDTLNLY